ncbi:MAG: efflux RND transporter permease subunit [Luteibaculaceae bacterium]
MSSNNLSSISINRPVLASVMSIVVILFGVIGFTYLGVREFPSVDPPVVTVTTNYPGANADIIESQITEVLEESINGIDGIRTISSVSSDGRSTITVEFELGVDMEAAANDVRDKTSRAIRNLPQDADPPIVVKSDADVETILTVTVQSDKRDLLDLTKVGTDIFKERLQTVKGISEIYLWGEKKYAMKLLIDPERLSAYGLTPLDIRNALERENVELPSGRIEGLKTELTIRTFGRLVTEEDFNNMIIESRDGVLIRFKEVGRAVLLPENERTLLRGDGGIPMIGVAINPLPGSNYIEVVDEVFKRVDQIKKELPEDLRIGVALDATESIRSAISDVKFTILYAFLLVVLVIYFFLRSWRTLIIPIVTIPISLIGAFFIMYISGFSINILTLLGIVLATGLVVDDAIVVMEVIYAKVEKGMKPIEAAHRGSREIFFAIISTTVTLCAVFLPIIFLEGLTGRLFREFGVVVAGAVVISTFVSLSLTPMLSSKILKKSTKKEPRILVRIEIFLRSLANGYKSSLAKIMERRIIAVFIMSFCLGAMFFTFTQLKSELAPREDKSRFSINSTAPEGTSYEMMLDFVGEMMALVDTLPEKKSILAVTSPGFGASINVNSGFIRVRLVEPNQRDRSQAQIVNDLMPYLSQKSFARSFPIQEETIGGGRRGGLPVQFVLQAPNFEKLKEVLPIFLEEAKQRPEFSVVDVDLKFNKPELQVTINREKAREMGVSVRDISETLQLFFAGQRFGYFIMDGKQYQVIGQADRVNRNEPLDLRSITVRNTEGDIVQIDNLVSIEDKTDSPQLYRYNRYVSAKVSANLAEGYAMGQGIQAMEQIAKEVLDDTFSTALDGPSKEFKESSNSLLFAFLLALALIYLVLAAQFESYRDPFIIMFTVPLALAGALLSLYLTGNTLNIFSQIGMIVLIGIVTKNGILIVEYANQLQEEGLSKMEAAKQAAELRFRPILMTSMATVLGALPIAFATGGATSRIPMGIVIIGGLLFSLVLTLYVIPALYTYLSGKKKRLVETYENTPAN